MSKSWQRKNKWTDKDVEKHWDNVAAIYVEENNKVRQTHDQRFKVSSQNLDLFPGAKILNITSRDAEADIYLKKAENELEIINAEISQKLMDVAYQLNPKIYQEKIDCYDNLPFETGFFDRILTLETLEHVAYPLGFLNELNRVCKPNSKMVLSCPPATSEIPYQVYTALFGGHGEGPHRFLASKEVKKMLRETGWKLLKHIPSLLVPVGPRWLKNSGEKFINRFPKSIIAEFGIRQFYICEKN